MKLVLNPEYETAPFEGAVLDKDGNKLSPEAVCMAFGRIRPPRYKLKKNGELMEVLSHVFEHELE